MSYKAWGPADHPLRSTRAVMDEALEVLCPELKRLYSKVGRPSIAPEKLLQAFFSIRSERQLMEQLYNSLLLFWFVGLPMVAKVWGANVFSKNRDRPLEGDIAARSSRRRC